MFISNKIFDTHTGLKFLLFTSIMVSFNVNASDDWSGYITDKLLNSENYGYSSTISDSNPTSKLWLVCQPNSVFTLLADGIISSDTTSSVKITVDGLPAVYLTASRVNNRFEISNQNPEFWRLIAQMSAGVKLVIDSGSGVLHQYSLSGFTNSFLNVCDWSVEAKQFQQYLDEYR